MASNSNIATFIFNDEELVLFPGSRFSKQELKTRLKEMGINDNNSQDREYLKNLYDLAMKDYKNRASIIRRIKKDTEIINSRIYQSQKRSIPSSNMDNPNELEQKKLMNISYDVDKIYQNAKNKYYSNNNNYSNQNNYERQNFNNTGYNNDIINQNNNDSDYYYNNRNDKNIEYNKQNETNNYYNNNNNFPNKQNENYNKQYEEINTNINSNNYPNNKKQNDYSQYNKYNQYQEKRNNPYFLKKAKNMYTIPESQFENDYDEYSTNSKKGYDNNNNNQRHYQKIEIIPKRNSPKKIINNQNNIYDNNKIELNNKPKEYNNRLSFTNALNKGISKYDAKNENNEDNNNNERDDIIQNNNDNKDINNENTKIKKDPDEISTFSFFSAFENVKKSPLIKNWKFILIHLLILFSFLVLSVSFLHLIYNKRESILNFISKIFEFLSQPKQILDLVRNFISFLFYGSIHHWYVILPVIILIFVFYFYVRKYLFKKRCEEIIEKIVQDLKKTEDERISQDDIYKKYVQKYGVSYNKFIKKYLPKLDKLRKKDHRLKKSSMIYNENTFVFWELA